MNTITDFINEKWATPESLSEQYQSASPFPHLVMEDFVRGELLNSVEEEFPDLSQQRTANVIAFKNEKEIKLAGKGMAVLSPAAFRLTSHINSDLFLKYLQELTGVKETLISDPYLAGGGYHQIKKGGMLKVHADFNKHPKMDLDRRLNLLIYLNKNWKDEWGGELELFNRDMSGPVVKVLPKFNTAVLFTTTSFTFHGHPDPLVCPDDVSRKSIAYYFFSQGRPASEVSGKHSTLFKKRMGENFTRLPSSSKQIFRGLAKDLCPPLIWRGVKIVMGK